MDATITVYNMIHYGDNARKLVSQERDRKQSELFAHFIDQLKPTKESDGSSSFDQNTLTLGSNIHIYYLTNCPTVVTGRGSGIQHGRHLVTPDKAPLCNLWLSLANGLGIATESHGDSKGQFEELFV